MCCRWRCATRCSWRGNARRSIICRTGACCRLSASAARWVRNGPPSTSTPRRAAARPMRGSKSSGGCGRRTRSISRGCIITYRARRLRQSRCSRICRCGSAARPRRRYGAPRASARAGRPAPRRRSRPRRSSPRSRPLVSRRAARSTTIITAPASRSALGGWTIRHWGRCSRRTGSAPAVIPRIISRSATPRRLSKRSPITSRRACRNSSCARPPRATTK